MFNVTGDFEINLGKISGIKRFVKRQLATGGNIQSKEKVASVE